MDTYKQAPIPTRGKMAIERKPTTIDAGVADFLRNLSDPMPKIYSYAVAREPGTTILTVLLKVSPEELERIMKGGESDDA